MAGFLDSKEQIIDMILTGVGRSLLMRGDLRFVYWVPFDDEVDYSAMASGSLSSGDPLVREASAGYQTLNRLEEDRTNVSLPMHTIPSERDILPSMQVDGVSGTVEVKLSQRRVQVSYARGADVIGTADGGVQRHSPSESVVEFRHTPGSYPEGYDAEGFLVTVYRSGSDGYTEVLHNRDSSGSIVYGNDLKLEII